jgi:hypothetical protein
MVSFIPVALYSWGNSPQYQLNRRMRVNPRAGLIDVKK